MTDSALLTVRDAITAAVMSALAGAADELELEPAGDPSRFPALGAVFGGHRVLEREAGLTRYEMPVTIDGFVDGEGGEAPSAARNALQADVVTRLVADGQLGGIVELIEDDDCRMFTAALANVRRLGFAQDFTVQFTTARGNPALPA
jgi:hypothetical protein